MPVVKSLADLKRVKEEAKEKRKEQATAGRALITVSLGMCGIAVGARDTMNAILAVIEEENLTNITVAQTGCIGLCEWEPIVEVVIGDQPKVTYVKVDPDMAKRITMEHAVGSKVIPEYEIPA